MSAECEVSKRRQPYELFAVTFSLLKIEQRLSLDHCHLIGIGGECMDVQLGSSGLEVNVAEWLKLVDLQFRDLHKHAPVAGETFEIGIALSIQIGTHLLDLEVGHVAYSTAQSALVSSWAAELKTFDQAPGGQHLAGCADNFSKTCVACENADNMRATGEPDNRLVLLGTQFPVGVNLKKLRVQRSLEKTEHQFFDGYVHLR